FNQTHAPVSRDSNSNGVPDECEANVVFHRGDAHNDGGADLSDAVFILNYLFLGRATPSCMEAADVQNDGKVNIADPTYLLNYLFLGGAPPTSPGLPPTPCGPDTDLPGSARDLG